MTEPRTINLTLPYPPSSNRYWRSRVVRLKTTGKYAAITYLSEEAKDFKAKVAERYQGMQKPLLGDVAVTVKVFRKIKAGDYHNRLKVLFDALEGIAYINDSQIVEEHSFRFDSPTNPRVEIEIRELNTVAELFPAEILEKSDIPF
jgi:crossover junction endodeoxyribonuclease RusA